MHSHVVTMIAAPQQAALTEAAARDVAMRLGGSEPVWLARDTACDLFLNRAPSPEEIDALRLAWPDYDLIAQPSAHRRKKLLVADMDSTVIQQECIDELADFAGMRAKVEPITERAMNGELDFAAALTERVALLEGLPESVLEEVFATRITLMPGARELVNAMAAQGAHCALVSGGFTFFTARVAELAGFHAHHANRLEIRGGRLTGRVVPPILGKEAKLETLHALRAARQLASGETLTVGDGANDLPMLQAAGLGVAYHAKPHVRAQIPHHINRADLRALLYIQGYTA